MVDVEKLFRDKVNYKNRGGVGSFRLRGTFQVFDRCARGGVDLEDFRQAIATVRNSSFSPFSRVGHIHLSHLA